MCVQLRCRSLWGLYIRRTQTRSRINSERYYTHRLVRSERVDGKVRQSTLLNLGRHFEVDRARWPELCARVEQLLGGQAPLLVVSCPAQVEWEAQRIAAQLLVRQSEVAGTSGPGSERNTGQTKGCRDIQAVEVDSLEWVRPRSVGGEQLGLWAMEPVGFESMLQGLGMSGPQRAAILGSIIARMVAPASERATHRWLRERSGLGELLGVDFETLKLKALYRASDWLHRHQERLEAQLFEQVADLFALPITVTLYDLTNPYFEGEGKANPKARRGHSQGEA